MQCDFAKADFGDDEREAVCRVMEGYWLASGNENLDFEKEFAEYIGVKEAICVNSGSMANLIALKALYLKRGSKVLTAAAGFPATLSPLLHLGLEPVLVDYDLDTHNIDIEQAIKKLPDVKAVILAHTMGSPVDVQRLKYFAEDLGVPIIEDCCESVGASIFKKKIGSIGKAGTFSFYPAHQITALGGGGMITTDDENYAQECRSLRDWGKIWNWDTKIGDTVTGFTQSPYLDFPYYKGYTYQSVGYNAKLPEANCAFAREQLKKLDIFVEVRRRNYLYLKELMKDEKCFIDIKYEENATPSWFGYIFTFKIHSPNKRNSLVDFLEKAGVRTRPFFGGNITRHKPFRFLESAFPVADHLMFNSFFVGVHQLLTKEHIEYIA